MEALTVEQLTLQQLRSRVLHSPEEAVQVLCFMQMETHILQIL